MLYRYRLNLSNNRNQQFRSRVIQGIKLRIDKWFYSREKQLQSYIGDIVEEQSALDMLEFNNIDKEILSAFKKIENNTKSELKEIAYDLGYDYEDLLGKKKEELIQLIKDHSKQGE